MKGFVRMESGERRLPPTPERTVEVSLRGTDAYAECPFCGQSARAVAPEGGEGLWSVSESCQHCRGIYSTGRWDTGAVMFKGAMIRVAVCHCGEAVPYYQYREHKRTQNDPTEHCIVSEEWRDRL